MSSTPGSWCISNEGASAAPDLRSRQVGVEIQPPPALPASGPSFVVVQGISPTVPRDPIDRVWTAIMGCPSRGGRFIHNHTPSEIDVWSGTKHHCARHVDDRNHPKENRNRYSRYHGDGTACGPDSTSEAELPPIRVGQRREESGGQRPDIRRTLRTWTEVGRACCGCRCTDRSRRCGPRDGRRSGNLDLLRRCHKSRGKEGKQATLLCLRRDGNHRMPLLQRHRCNNGRLGEWPNGEFHLHQLRWKGIDHLHHVQRNRGATQIP